MKRPVSVRSKNDVVPIQRDIGEQSNTDGGDNDTGRRERRRPAAQVQRQPQAEREQQEQRCAPRSEIEGVGDRLVRGGETGHQGEDERQDKERGLNLGSNSIASATRPTQRHASARTLTNRPSSVTLRK